MARNAGDRDASERNVVDVSPVAQVGSLDGDRRATLPRNTGWLDVGDLSLRIIRVGVCADDGAIVNGLDGEVDWARVAEIGEGCDSPRIAEILDRRGRAIDSYGGDIVGFDSINPNAISSRKGSLFGVGYRADGATSL